MNRILLISYSYSPHLTPRALRWGSVAEYLSEKGLDVEVICSWDPGSPRVEIRNGVRVHRRGSAFVEKARLMLLGRSAFNMGKAVKGNPPTSTIIKRMVKAIHDLTWKKIYWPDYAALWYRDALKCAKDLMAHSTYDAIITVAPPFTGHLVGLALKRQFPSVRWIVDSGDPFCFAELSTMNNQRLYRALNRRAEGRVFRYADGLSVTTAETSRIYGEIFPFSENKLRIIPPLLNPGFVRLMDESRSRPADGKIRLLYVGNFHKHLREPETYMKAMERVVSFDPDLLDRLELHFFGSTNLVLECLDRHPLLRPLCEIHGRSGQPEVVRAMSEADVLVNIGNATSYQLPSKVIEYAYTGKPILNFSVLAEDSSAAFLNKYPLMLNICENGAEIRVETMVTFLKEALGKKMKKARIDQFVNAYTVDRISGQYLSFLIDNSAVDGACISNENG